MTYKKRCDGCEKEIWIDQVNGKWHAYDDEYGTVAHLRHGSSNLNLIKRFQKIESDISTLYKIVDNHSKRLEKFDDEK